MIFGIQKIEGLGNSPEEVIRNSDLEHMSEVFGRFKKLVCSIGFKEPDWEFQGPSIDGIELGVGVGAEDLYSFGFLSKKDPEDKFNNQIIDLSGSFVLDTSGAFSQGAYFLSLSFNHHHSGLLFPILTT